MGCDRKAEDRVTVRAPVSAGVLDEVAADALRGFGHGFAEDVASRNFAGIAEKFDFGLHARGFDFLSALPAD